MDRPMSSAEHLEISQEARTLYLRLAAGDPSVPTDGPAVEQLLNLGLARLDPASPPSVTLVDPRYVGAQWEAAFHAYATAMLEQAAAVPDLLRDLSKAYDQRADDPGAGVLECIRGSEAINSRMGQILASAAEELLVCQPGRARRVELIQEARERDLGTLRRGVTMRTIYHDDVRASAPMHGWVRDMAEAGAETRTLAEAFQRMIIIDRRTAVIPGDSILTDSQSAVAYIVHDRGVAGFLAGAFERDWSRARPWDGKPQHPKLTDRHLIVLRELEAETSMEAIATQLGVSLRTVNNLIAEIRVAFGVRTPFGMACAWKAYQDAN